MQIVILLTLLTLLPAVVMSITPFLRITVVLHFLRQALGTQTTPSNQVLVGMSLFLTAADHAAGGGGDVPPGLGAAAKPGRSTVAQAVERRRSRCAAFLVRFAREKDIRLFRRDHARAAAAHAGRPGSAKF